MLDKQTCKETQDIGKNKDTFKNRIVQSKEWQDWVKYQEYCLTDEYENEMYAPWDAQEIDKISREHLQAFYKFIIKQTF